MGFDQVFSEEKTTMISVIAAEALLDFWSKRWLTFLDILILLSGVQVDAKCLKHFETTPNPEGWMIWFPFFVRSFSYFSPGLWGSIKTFSFAQDVIDAPADIRFAAKAPLSPKDKSICLISPNLNKNAIFLRVGLAQKIL